MAHGGKRAGAGNPGYGLTKKIGVLKNTLLDAVMADCKKNPERRLFWAEKFVNRLMPQEVGGLDGKELVIQFDPSFNAVARKTTTDSRELRAV